MDEIMESEKELQEPAETPRRDARVGVLALLIGILAVGAGTWYYLQARAYEETDNAFIDGNVIQVSPRVSGRVLRVSVDDNQHVNRGDLIAEIDPSDFETSLAQAQARLKVMEAQESGAQSGVDLTSTVTGAVLVQADAGLQVAREQVQVLRADWSRTSRRFRRQKRGYSRPNPGRRPPRPNLTAPATMLSVTARSMKKTKFPGKCWTARRRTPRPRPRTSKPPGKR